MGYVLVFGACGSCRKMFSYNPHWVPSYKNIPFCRDCVEAATPARIKNGLAPIYIHPEAYEILNEADL